MLVEADEPGENGSSGRRHSVKPEDIDPAQSILAQRKGFDRYPEITYLGKVFSDIYLFRSPNMGHGSPTRGPKPADLPAHFFLLENGSNLGVVLSVLLSNPVHKRAILAKLRRFNGHIEDLTTRVVAGTVETLVRERLAGGYPFDPIVRRHPPIPLPIDDPVPSRAAAADLYRRSGVGVAS